jgi:hypothetical protein
MSFPTVANFAVTVLMVIVTAGVIHGDVIRLKSGGTVNGIIVAHEGGSVTVNIGFGRRHPEKPSGSRRRRTPWDVISQELHGQQSTDRTKKSF